MTDPPRERCRGKRRPDRKPAKKPRGPNRFTEREVARAGRAGKAIGAERVEFDPATGKISIIIAKSGESVADNELDKWLKGRNAR